MKKVEERDHAEDSPVSQTVDILIGDGINKGASDIHIEPREKHIIVRYRIDGLLREANKLPRKLSDVIVGHIKKLASLNIDEHRALQDGQFKIEEDGQTYVLRVSILPTIDGEKVVIHVLNESLKPADLSDLGFWGESLRQLHHAIVQPHGLVIISGPIGSGKSTTLFSLLSSINTPNVNLSTIEDTVEYRISGANQVQLSSSTGMSFADGLKALLDQDPNIIMVGEIRDSETAKLSVDTALSGRLVFSTLHTDSAASSLTRLLDMGVEPFLLASTLRAVVNQRLVRRLCMSCREAFVPDAASLQRTLKSFDINARGGIKRIHELEAKAVEAGIGGENDTLKANTTPTAITKLYRAHRDGCEDCNHSGYKGRLAIYEVLANSSEVQKKLVTSSSSNVIENVAIDNDGMIDLQVDGLIKALFGLTTVEEILRVKAID